MPCIPIIRRLDFNMHIVDQEILNPGKLFWSRFFSQLTGTFSANRNANQPIDKTSIKKILILEHQCIGDVIMLEPTLRALKDYYTQAKIDLLCVPAVKEIAEKAGLADKILTFPEETPYDVHYDMVFDFHGDIRRIRMMQGLKTRYRAGFSFSGGTYWLSHVIDYPHREHQVERPFTLLKLLNIPVERTIPRMNLFSDIRKDPNLIVLHPGANHPNRLWPEEHWKTLVIALQKKGYKLIWLTPPGKTAPTGVDALSGSLLKIAEGIASSTLLICCDSMSGHLATALETHALAIFGSQNPKLTKPYGPLGHIIAPLEACKHNRSDWRLCAECMAAVKPSAVLEKVQKIIK